MPLDPQQISEKKAYLLSGGAMLDLHRSIQSIRSGEHVGRSGSVYKRAGGGGGFSLSVKPGGGRGGFAPTHPFRVYLRNTPDAPNTYQARVEYNSSLLKSVVLSDRQIITGLTQYNDDGSIADSSWFPFDQGNDLIWLEITLDPFGADGVTPTEATIKSWGQGGAWQPDDKPSEYGMGTGPFEAQTQYDSLGNRYFNQYISRIAIFASVTAGTGDFAQSNTQLLNTHLLMSGDVYSGQFYDDSNVVIPIVMPRPYAGPFVQT